MTKYLLLGIIFLMSSFSLRAQESTNDLEVIYSGLDNPTSIYATQDHLFVVESRKHRILKLDHEGELLETVGGLGSGDYQFDTPIDIDATNGLKIYISDYRNNRVQIFDRRFQYLSTIKNPQNQRSFRPTQVLVNGFGELFVYDESSKSIHRYDENGNWRDSFELSSIPEISEINLVRDNLELVSKAKKEVYLISQNGLIGEVFPLIEESPEVIASSKLGEIQFLLIGDQIQRRVLE